jgi:hypothetical protein
MALRIFLAAALIDAEGVRLTNHAVELYSAGRYAESEALNRSVLDAHSPHALDPNYIAELSNRLSRSQLRDERRRHASCSSAQ